MKREDVYKLIDEERDYQDDLWKPMGDDHHTPEEWFVYIEDYVNEAKHILTREYKDRYLKAMDIMRKVAAMAVCAMEQHHTEGRK